MRPHLELLLNNFADKGIYISAYKFRRARTILDQLKLGGLKANAAKIVDPVDGVVTSSGRMDFLAKDIENIDMLEANLQELKTKDGNFRPVLRRLIEAYCETNQPDKALEYKVEWDNSGYEPAAGILSRLIGVCSANNNQQEALKLRNELKAKFPEFKMDMLKYCQLIHGAVKENKIDVALNLVDDIKECGTSTDNVERRVFFLLQNLTEEGYIEEAKQLTRKFIDCNIVNSNNNILRPVVTALMDKRDMEGALSWIQECQAKYGFMPSFHDILVRLINEGDKDMLQKAMEFSSSHHGDINMLYDMTFAFLTTSKFDEAKKIIDTPGMIARAGRLQWYSEKCLVDQMQEQMEKLVEITKDLYNCNRDNLYFSLLQLYARKEDPNKCLQIWTNMQEEEVIPSDRTLRYLANVLKSHDQPIPYEVPQIMDMSPQSGITDINGDDSNIVKLCLEGNIDQALQLINDAKENKTSLKYKTLDTVILSALKLGDVDTALKVRDIIKEFGLTVNKLTNSAIFFHYIETDNLPAAENIFEDFIAKGIQPTVRMTRALALKYEQTGNMDKINNMIDQLGDSHDEQYQLYKYVLGALLYRNELDTAFTKIKEKLSETQNGDKVGLRSFFSKMIQNELPLDKG
ncbi:leucine-rich PPR motif-containing protein, mitochondrial-like [Anneissia japonica]|uniref:leucine-rich PPR motif-containing protein, mitochondrial-like n=1 Tax=Anneissia japonica TaxID=1529436 RepID=UPI001425B0AA|nr:leucine-rich PPR motif-containing protein, mitochondrial-like [Anneissia japonica]